MVFRKPREKTEVKLDRKSHFPGSILLRCIQRDEPVDSCVAVEPERCAEMRKVERARSGDSGKSAGVAKVEREIAEHEQAHVLLQPIDANLVLFLIQNGFPRQTYQIASRFQHEKYAGEEYGSGRFLR